jgi:hypothetical protein
MNFESGIAQRFSDLICVVNLGISSHVRRRGRVWSSGFYAAGQLLAGLPGARVDMFDRLPAPRGLVRSGVAPDHPKIKSVSRVFAKTATDPRYRFFGNVELGRDVTRADLLRHYGAIVYAVGAVRGCSEPARAPARPSRTGQGVRAGCTSGSIRRFIDLII